MDISRETWLRVGDVFKSLAGTRARSLEEVLHEVTAVAGEPLTLQAEAVVAECYFSLQTQLLPKRVQ